MNIKIAKNDEIGKNIRDGDGLATTTKRRTGKWLSYSLRFNNIYQVKLTAPLIGRGRLTSPATSSVGEGGDVVGTHLLAELLVAHAHLVGTLGRKSRHRRRVHAVAVLVRFLDDTLHFDVAVLAMELHLLVELGTHLRLLKLNLLLDVLVRLDLKLGVDFSGKSFAFFVDAQCFVIFQLL